MKPSQFLRGRLNASSEWRPKSDCSLPAHDAPPARVLRQLARHNVSIVFSGNSIMRHVFFRFASYLKGVAHDDFSQDERAREKELCTKELDADAGGGAGKFRKAFCKSGCCGVCSCAYEVGKESNSKAGVVPLYFIWQQEWYDSRMRKVWDALLQSAPFEGRRTYLIMNAGLVHARSQSLTCILHYQFPLLRDYLINGLPGANTTTTTAAAAAATATAAATSPTPALPRRMTRVIYMASPPTQHETEGAWLGAQDGMLKALFEGMPSANRPVWLDARPALKDWVDYIDVNHFGGRSAMTIIETIVHLALHWEVLYSPGGRGYEHERRATRLLNTFDEGPSSAGFLKGVRSQIDLAVSPPPAHSKMELCL